MVVAGNSKPVIGDENAGNIITRNGTYGINVSDLTALPLIRYNTFENNGTYPMRVRPLTGKDLAGNTFLENGIQAIELSEEDITSTTVWRNAGVPYVVTGDITVRHSGYDYAHGYLANARCGSALQPGHRALHRQVLQRFPQLLGGAQGAGDGGSPDRLDLQRPVSDARRLERGLFR
jgi:hypothetical protein